MIKNGISSHLCKGRALYILHNSQSRKLAGASWIPLRFGVCGVHVEEVTIELTSFVGDIDRHSMT